MFFPEGLENLQAPSCPHVLRIQQREKDAASHTAPSLLRNFLGKELFILHLCSKKHRPGDFQDYFEPMLNRYTGNVWAISTDIINDSKHGSKMKEDTVALWSSLIEARSVLATIAGLLCETLAAVRGVELADRSKGPPPCRSLEKIWGMPDVILRQTDRFCLSKTLYRTTILLAAKAARYGAASIMEHPDKSARRFEHPSS